jgi:hypothetical protein
MSSTFLLSLSKEKLQELKEAGVLFESPLSVKAVALLLLVLSLALVISGIETFDPFSEKGDSVGEAALIVAISAAFVVSITTLFLPLIFSKFATAGNRFGFAANFYRRKRIAEIIILLFLSLSAVGIFLLLIWGELTGLTTSFVVSNTADYPLKIDEIYVIIKKIAINFLVLVVILSVAAFIINLILFRHHYKEQLNIRRNKR